jgi:hypothetical protein
VADKPTSPTAKNFPSGLRETLVAAFIRSRDVHVREPVVSGRSAVNCVGEAVPPLTNLDDAGVRPLVSGADTGVEGW